MSENSRTVYSTSSGRICPDCGKPTDACECRKREQRSKGDGIARVRREVKGRRGKTVTTISGAPLNASGLLDLTTELKRHCGTGGSCKDGIIIIQGDLTGKVLSFLEKKGIKAKRAGG